ncbi:MAG: hypothetical protein HND48_10585 [Chloroflexi bacterium]|nr:hypothetical protein [Chloroflexota bacterium]
MDSSGFGTMVRYPFGLVDEQGAPFSGQAGKRIRPALVLLCADATGCDWRPAVPAAAAVELLHNFSLVHDDVQDDSPLRHGRPTGVADLGCRQRNQCRRRALRAESARSARPERRRRGAGHRDHGKPAVYRDGAQAHTRPTSRHAFRDGSGCLGRGVS